MTGVVIVITDGDVPLIQLSNTLHEFKGKIYVGTEMTKKRT